ncbi:MAG: hypothetical protein J5980_08550 [Muribaculaceae bacterium]|nr:hypothetical protein [Muribaculaceae bacterium]
MKTMSQTSASNRQLDYEQLQRCIEQQLRHIARRGFTPKPDNAAPRGWYRKLKRMFAK